MKKAWEYIKSHNILWIALIVIAGFVFFALLEHFIDDASTCWITDIPALDHKIPFLKVFVIPYISWYAYLAFIGVYLYVNNFKEFKRFAYFFIATYYLNLFICFLIPNAQTLRPDLSGESGFFITIIKHLYSIDTNTNVFPSEHVMGTIAAMIGILYGLKKFKGSWLVKFLFVIWGVAISVSTVLIKQHAIIDLIASVLFTALIYVLIYILPSWIRRKKENHVVFEKK